VKHGKEQKKKNCSDQRILKKRSVEFPR